MLQIQDGVQDGRQNLQMTITHIIYPKIVILVSTPHILGVRVAILD